MDDIKKIEALEKKVEMLEEKSKFLEKNAEGLSDGLAKVEKVKGNEALEKKVELLEKIVEDLSNGFAKMEEKATQSSLNVATEPAEKPTIPTETFVVDKVTYKFKYAGLHFGDKKILASEALNDEELLANIVKNYPNSVVKVS
jgi:cell division protein FtsB